MKRGFSRDGNPLSRIYSGFWRRLAANLIDLLVLIPIGFAGPGLTPHSKSLALFVAVSSGTVGLFYTICLHAAYGQTLGKMALGIRVLRTDGRRIGWPEAFWRSSVDVAFWAIHTVSSVMVVTSMPAEQLAGLSWAALQTAIGHTRKVTFLSYLGWLAYIWSYSEVFTLLFNEKKRALQDFIAGTVVALKGTEALVRDTQSWRGAPMSAGKFLRVGIQSAGVLAAGVVAMMAYIVGFSFFLTRTDTGVAIGERRGLFGARVVDVAPGVRLTRPEGWSVTEDGANGHIVHALGSRGDAKILVWSVPIEGLPGRSDRSQSDLSALGPAIAMEQRSRSKKALQDTWAAGVDFYAGYEIERSQVVTIDGRRWGEDFLLRRDRGKNYVLINRYTVHGDAVIVVVDGYQATSGDEVELQGREGVVTPVMQALEFSPQDHSRNSLTQRLQAPAGVHL